MHPSQRAFAVEIPANDPAAMERFQDMMDQMHDAQMKYIQDLAKEKNISERCASDVVYLRSRSRWSQENEDALIQLHKDGNPPNIFEWP